MENNYRDKEQDRRLEWLEKHYSNFNMEMGNIEKKVAKIETDVSWLKRNYWLVAGAAVGGLITGLINLLFK